MKKNLYRQFFANYLLVLSLSLLAGFCVLVLLSFADSMVSKSLIKNQYAASSLMQDDYTKIEMSGVVENKGGIQIIDDQYQVVFSAGLNNFENQQMSKGAFTKFLLDSQRIGTRYHYDVAYNERQDFWLVVTFPTSIRIDFDVVMNKDAMPSEIRNVGFILGGALLLYLLLLAGFSVLLSKITALGIIRPLRKLTEGARLLREGDYSARVDLRLSNEFAVLQDTFNDMAERIEREIALREQSETDRRQLILDISHDLKNPLASVAGYAELCLNQPNLPAAERNKYLQVIQNNSLRANKLLTELFELSKLESPAFSLKKVDVDLCEYLRQIGGDLIPLLEKEGLEYDFDIPEQPVMAAIDPEQMSRVFHNLTENAIRYSGTGTRITLKIDIEPEWINISFSDNGPGMEEALAEVIFKPFVRRDQSRNTETGGSGLGLSIVAKIIEAHQGTISLKCAKDQGCDFLIRLPLS